MTACSVGTTPTTKSPRSTTMMTATRPAGTTTTTVATTPATATIHAGTTAPTVATTPATATTPPGTTAPTVATTPATATTPPGTTAPTVATTPATATTPTTAVALGPVAALPNNSESHQRKKPSGLPLFSAACAVWLGSSRPERTHYHLGVPGPGIEIDPDHVAAVRDAGPCGHQTSCPTASPESTSP